MALYKHQKSKYWYVNVIKPDGTRTRHSTKTADRQRAQEYHDNLCASFWRQQKLHEAPEHTFYQAAQLYLQATQGRSNYRNVAQHVQHWLRYFTGTPVRSLTTEMIEQATPTMTRLPHGSQRVTSAATRNRYLATMCKILNDCHRRGWLDRVPHVPKFREANLRENFFTKQQAAQLLNAMPDGWMRDVTLMAFATGMRRGELLSLEWSAVFLEAGYVSVLASKAKSGKGRPVPLNEDAKAVLLRRRNKHPQYVFTASGKRTYDIDRRVFVRALRQAGLPREFRFHDCRHAWASWQAQAGTPMLTLQRLGGWQTLSMLNRYAHLTLDDLRQYAQACKL